MIWNAIMKLIWFIFIQGPLNLIAAFNKVLEYLTGGIINDILFGSSKDFKWKNIPIQFWWFTVVALCIFSLIFTIQMIILMFKDSTETKSKFVLSIQNAFKAFIFMFLIPIFFFIANFIIQNLANTVINNFGNNSNISQYLWHIGDSTWDGTTNGVPNDYGYPYNINKYNMLAQIFGTWFMLFAIFMIGIILIQKIIELFFLFVISPIVMIVMIVDNGKAAFTWKDMVGAKFLASTGTLIGYYIYISVTQILLNSNLNSLQTSDFSKSLFIILYLCGGGIATMGFSDMINHFVGESAGIREGMSSIRSTVAGGMMAMGASKIASKVIGFSKSKRVTTKFLTNSANDFSDDSNTNISNNNSQTSQGLNFATFHNANNGLSSRTGIIGLAGLALTASAIGASKFQAGKKVGGFKTGIKYFNKSLVSSVTSPVKSLANNLNPQLIKFSKAKITSEKQAIINSEIKNNESKIALQEQKLAKLNIKNKPNLENKISNKIKKLEDYQNNLQKQKNEKQSSN